MKSIKSDKGQAGLTILLSVITFLFVIGLLTMIFVLMNAGIINSDSLYLDDTATIVNETLLADNINSSVGANFANVDLRKVECTLGLVTNATGGNIIQAANYTQRNCNIINATGEKVYDWNVSYTITYLSPTAAVDVANETSSSIATVTDWFPLFIVITAMVVLILLTVIIITSIRSSGLMGGNQGNSGVGKTGHA